MEQANANINSLVENRFKSWQNTGEALTQEYSGFIKKINEHRKVKGQTPMDAVTARNVALCLDNAVMEASLNGSGAGKLFETVPGTAASNIAFLGVQLPIISAILPSLVLNEIATIQALDRRQGSVFYFDMISTYSKGSINAGSTLVSSKTGQVRSQEGRLFGSSLTQETAGSQGGSSLSYTATILPVKPNTVIITDGSEIWTDTGTGTSSNLVSNYSGYAAGSINYATGVVSLTWTGHTAVNQPTFTYGYSYDAQTSGQSGSSVTAGSSVPTVNFNMSSSNIQAIDFPLQSTYSMAAALDLKKAHGMDLESEMVKLLGGEIKFELDHRGIDLMYIAATDPKNGAGQATNFSGTVQSGQEWVWLKYQFINNLLQCSNLIQAKTLRGIGNFVVGDLNVSRLVMQLKPDFEPIAGLNTALITGPTKIGTIMGRPMIQDPFLTTNQYFMGYKGDSFLMSSFIFAPYIPLFSTPTLVTSDLIAQKGFMSSAGYFTVNAGLFGYGTITNV
jgi:hypothetical protein